MDLIQVQNLSRAGIQNVQAGLCASFFSRFLGLMLQEKIMPDGGILIDESSDSLINSSIHMLFMKFPIAVIWINTKMTVVDSVLANPWKPYYAPKSPARYILETHPDRLSDYQIGDMIGFKSL